MSASSLPFSTVLLGNLAIAAAIFGAGWLLSKVAFKQVAGMALKRTQDTMLARFLGSLAQWSVVAAAVIASLGRVGVETTSLVAILGSAGVAVGLALQGNLSNFASGVMVLVFRPITVGDTVTVAGHTGRVEDLGIFATTLVTPENNTIILGNSAVTKGPIVNFTRRGTRRGAVAVGVAYGSDLATVRAVLLAAAQASPHVLDDPGVSIVFTDLGASSLEFSVRCWSDSSSHGAMLDDVRSRIYDALAEAGIEIPYQTLVVHSPDGAA